MSQSAAAGVAELRFNHTHRCALGRATVEHRQASQLWRPSSSDRFSPFC